MSLQVKHAEGLCMPIVVCDQCQRQISDAKVGMAFWNSQQPKHVYFLHKGACDRVCTFTRELDLDCWEELSKFLVYLRNNTINEKAPTDQKGT